MDRDAEVTALKQGRRPHYVREWAERRGVRQGDIVREIGADKSLVSRWFRDTLPATPSAPWQKKLAQYFGVTPEALFRHPDEDWVANFLAGRKPEEIDRIKATMETAFPKAS